MLQPLNERSIFSSFIIVSLRAQNSVPLLKRSNFVPTTLTVQSRSAQIVNFMMFLTVLQYSGLLIIVANNGDQDHIAWIGRLIFVHIVFIYTQQETGFLFKIIYLSFL